MTWILSGGAASRFQHWYYLGRGYEGTHSYMLSSDPRPPFIHNDHRPTNSPPVTGDMDSLMVVIRIHRHKLANPARPPHPPELRHEARRMARKTHDRPIHIHHERIRAVDLRPRRLADVCSSIIQQTEEGKKGRRGGGRRTLNPQHKRQPHDRLLLHIRRNMRHQR